MKDKIAIQGFQASFHEIAAFKFFGKIVETYECDTFEKLFDGMAKKKATYAIMAIENSVAGSILPNYARLRESGLEIFGEVYLRIEMNFMALKGQKVADIEEVHSHPMALLQCNEYFRKHPDIQLIESKDTALSAQEIKDHHIRGRGALASSRAAELFGLDILAKGIETNKRNFTRFLALKRKEDIAPLALSIPNKSSLSFRTANDPGSLAKVLTIMGEYDINLTKIQSLPVLGQEWVYYFYADLEFENYDKYLKMLQKAAPHLFELKILGEYKQGEKIL